MTYFKRNENRFDIPAPTEPPPAPPVTEPITEPTTAEPGDRPTTEEPEIIVVEGQFCDFNNPCPSPYQCSKFSSCVCPVGYYGNEAGTLCLAGEIFFLLPLYENTVFGHKFPPPPF